MKGSFFSKANINNAHFNGTPTVVFFVAAKQQDPRVAARGADASFLERQKFTYGLNEAKGCDQRQVYLWISPSAARCFVYEIVLSHAQIREGSLQLTAPGKWSMRLLNLHSGVYRCFEAIYMNSLIGTAGRAPSLDHDRAPPFATGAQESNTKTVLVRPNNDVAREARRCVRKNARYVIIRAVRLDV